MREYIIEQMKQGKSLEDIHMEVEQMFNDEYNKREAEIEKKLAQIDTARKVAARAMADYLALVTGIEGSIEDCEATLVELEAGLLASLTAVKKQEQKKKSMTDDEKLARFLASICI